MHRDMVRERLSSVRGFVFDMDGTLVLARKPKGAGSDWTDERGTSEEGRRNLTGARRRAGKQSDRGGHGLRPLPGALEIIRWAAERGLPYVVFTNGTVHSPAHYARTMRELGFVLPDEAMMTPASSAIRVFTREGYKRVMLLGGSGIAGPLREAGLEVVVPVMGSTADAVLAGWYPEFTMPALEAACQAVWEALRARDGPGR